MTQQIPLLDNPRQSLITDLAGQVVRLSVWWQPNDSGWYASLDYPVGTRIISGKRIVLDQPLLYPTRSLFVGDFYCRGVPPTSSEPGRNAWAVPTHIYLYEQ